MQDWNSLGKVLLVWGGLLALIGALLMAAGKLVRGGQSGLVKLVRQTSRGYPDQAGSRHILLSPGHQPLDQCGGHPSALSVFQTMMARSFALLLVWSLVVAALPVSAQADDVIRVLLAQDVPRIQISAERRLSVRGGSGQELVFAAPVTIVAAPDGTVSLNGEPFSSIAGLTVSSGGEGLLLSVGQGGESYAPLLP